MGLHRQTTYTLYNIFNRFEPLQVMTIDTVDSRTIFNCAKLRDEI